MNRILVVFSAVLLLLLTASSLAPVGLAQADNPAPPGNVVKLIFIHHSTGENWLTDGYGDLGRTLGDNNYFVSDTNYGWGPNGIGDRTDIPNWMEWFRSSDTPTYMNALYNESGQNSGFTRRLADPGGENQIIMFKSCFPNSELTGNPTDPAGTYEDLSVSGAKYVYNQLLPYFGSRPDKLFVVITAPPLSDPTYAANARAFNVWLVNDWLRENNYTLGNVAVFDFYNVLTHPDAHHRFNAGAIEHVTGNSNTLNYPSGDDHPSQAGSLKATQEFVPLLNVFYNRWKSAGGGQPAAQPAAPTGENAPAPGEGAPQVEPYSGQPALTGSIDDFEKDNPPGTNGWEPFWDEATPTSMHCTAEGGQAHGGQRSLLLDFDVSQGGWATCAIFYDAGQNWSGAEGINFYLLSSQAGLVFNVDLYAGSQDARETYMYTIESPPDSLNGWVPISLRWSDFHRADWEPGGGTPFSRPDQIAGMAFGFNTYEGANNTGKLWVDDLALMGGETAAAPAQQPGAPVSGAESPGETDRGSPFPCGGALGLPLGLVTLAFAGKVKLAKKQRS